MSDLDGTTYLGDRLLPGARELYDLLHEQGRKILYLTNNSSRSAEEYRGKLSRLGIPALPSEVLTSGTATIRYLRQQGNCRRLFALAAPGFEGELRSAGFQLVSDVADRPDCVVLAFDTTLTYEKLRRACAMILAGARFVATHPDPVCPTPDGPIPDCGSMIALISKATGAVPTVIGKPNRAMLTYALEHIGCAANEAAMIGDRLATDMRIGIQAGLTTILVESSATARENRAPELAAIEPDYRLASLMELIEQLQR